MDLAQHPEAALSTTPASAADASAPSSAQPPARSTRRLWLLLSLGGPVAFIGALPYLLPLLRASIETARAAGHSVPALPIVVLGQMAQLSVFTAFAAWVGARLSARTGFDAPYLRALVEKREAQAASADPSGASTVDSIQPAARRNFLREIPRALVVGALFSIAVLILSHFANPYLPEALRSSAQMPPAASGRLSSFLVGASSALYGGIAEELLLRWGVLSALAALFSLTRARPAIRFWAANLASALLFGAGHLPAVHALGIPLTLATVGFIVVANALAGLACGWLFFKRGLESAMVAHGFGDICLHALPMLFA